MRLTRPLCPGRSQPGEVRCGGASSDRKDPPARMTRSPTDTAPPGAGPDSREPARPVAGVPRRRLPASGKATSEPRAPRGARALRFVTRRPDAVAALAYLALALWACAGL